MIVPTDIKLCLHSFHSAPDQGSVKIPRKYLQLDFGNIAIYNSGICIRQSNLAPVYWQNNTGTPIETDKQTEKGKWWMNV